MFLENLTVKILVTMNLEHYYVPSIADSGIYGNNEFGIFLRFESSG